MKWWVGLLLALVVATTAFAASHWASIPAAHKGSAFSMEEKCSTCHKGSAPQTHTREFILRDHGPAARASRQECSGCHENVKESCDQCHQSEAPKWHSPDFIYPVLGEVEMGEHIRIARRHRESCRECHSATYMTRCMNCHRPEDDWLDRGKGQDKADDSPKPLKGAPR